MLSPPEMTAPASIDHFSSAFAMLDGSPPYGIGGDTEDYPMIVWNGFLSSSYASRDVAPALDEAEYLYSIPTCGAMATATSPRATS
jgi:hypothetical protein